MRIHARLLLGLYGLVLAVPTIAAAAPLGDDEAGYATAGGQPPSQPAPHHHHKGLFGRRHCVECQRAYVKAHDGVDVPAPPADRGRCDDARSGCWPPRLRACARLPGERSCVGTGHDGQRVRSWLRGGRRPGHDGQRQCTGLCRCGWHRVRSTSRARSVSREPVRIRGMAAMGPRPGAGAYDPSVVPTSIPPAQVALAGPGHDRPHVIGHLLGIPKFGSNAARTRG